MTFADTAPAGLLLITIDRLPAWILPAYGATWVAMPRLDALAARGVVFDRVITPSDDPRQTLHALAGDDAGPAAAAPGPAPLATAALSAGWRMAVVTDDPATASAALLGDVGTAAGAEAVTVKVVVPGATGGVRRGPEETAIARLFDAAVEAVAAGHRLVWCHVSSLGMVWDAPPGYRDRYVDPEDPPPPAGGRVPCLRVNADTDPDLIVGYRQVFAGQLTLLDEQIGRLAASLPEQGGRGGRGSGWGVVVAGVRGMPLGIHGWIGPGGPSLPFGELVHVPAILVDPAARMAGQRFGGLVVPGDLGATLVDLVAGGAGHHAEENPRCPQAGRSLAGLFRDWSAEPREQVMTAAEGGVAVVTPSWHAIVAGRRTPEAAAGPVQLFAKPDDFFELADVADRCPDIAERFASLAAAPAASCAGRPVDIPLIERVLEPDSRGPDG